MLSWGAYRDRGEWLQSNPTPDGQPLQPHLRWVRSFGRQIQYKAIPISTALYSYSTDVKCFNLYKHYHDMCIKRALRQGEVTYNLVSFMRPVGSTRNPPKSTHSSYNSNGFLTTGLWPLDEETCINQLKSLSQTALLITSVCILLKHFETPFLDLRPFAKLQWRCSTGRCSELLVLEWRKPDLVFVWSGVCSSLASGTGTDLVSGLGYITTTNI